MTRLRLVASTGSVHRARSAVAPSLRLVSNTGSRSHSHPARDATPRRRWLSFALSLGAVAAATLAAVGGYAPAGTGPGVAPIEADREQD